MEIDDLSPTLQYGIGIIEQKYLLKQRRDKFGNFIKTGKK